MHLNLKLAVQGITWLGRLSETPLRTAGVFCCCRCAFSARFSMLRLRAAWSRQNLSGSAVSARIWANSTRFTSGFVPVQGLPSPAPRVGFSQPRRLGQGLGCEERRLRQRGAGKSPRLWWDSELSLEVAQWTQREAPTLEARRYHPGAPAGRGAGGVSAELGVPTRRAYFLGGRGGGIGPGRGTPGG